MTTDRIRIQRDVTAMVAGDTVELLADRVRALLSHGRRLTLCQRYATYIDDRPEVTAGLTLDGEPRSWANEDSSGFQVVLQPGIMSGFAFTAYHLLGAATEADAWKQYHAGKSISDNPFDRRRDITRVRVTGGLPGDGPARNDTIEIRAWNGDGVCTETVVAFDYETGQHNSLTRMRDELRQHMATLGDQQPWDNRAMFDRLLKALDANAAADGGDE